MQKNITHPVACRLIQEIIELIPMKSRGTYNRADPTAYEKGHTLMEGLFIEYHDCTWGVELSISTSSPNGKYPYRKLAAIYLTWEEKPRKWDEKKQRYVYQGTYPVLIPRNTWHNTWFKFLYDVREILRRREQMRDLQQECI